MAQDNVDVVQGAWDAWKAGDLDRAASVVAPEGEVNAPSTLPWGGTFLGPEGFRDFLLGLMGHFRDLKATPDKVLGADDDHVIVTAKVRGRTKAGGTFEETTVWLYKLRGGQVISADAFLDTAQMLKALDPPAS
ncbi:MAG: nuclear transport factor 2 family protein [Solirubrobacterales bacterium]